MPDPVSSVNVASVRSPAASVLVGGPPRANTWTLAFLVSAVVHGGGYYLAARLPSAAFLAGASSAVEFTVEKPPESEPTADTPVEPDEPEAEPAATANEPPPADDPTASDEPEESEADPADDESEPSADEAVDLTGVTLTGTGDEGWASLTGDGRAMTGPLGKIGSSRAKQGKARRRAGRGRRVAQPVRASQPQPSVVRAADLSRPPRAPNLNAVLRDHYPQDARLAGISGTAVVRARIEPDGRVSRVRVISESHAGFGAACSATLQGSKWSAPEDRDGKSVATEITYTCTFRVQR